MGLIFTMSQFCQRQWSIQWGGFLRLLSGIWKNSVDTGLYKGLGIQTALAGNSMVFPLAMCPNNDSGDIVLSKWQWFAELCFLHFSHQFKRQHLFIFSLCFSSCHFLFISVSLCSLHVVYSKCLFLFFLMSLWQKHGALNSPMQAAWRVSVCVEASKAQQCKPPRGKLSI